MGDAKTISVATHDPSSRRSSRARRVPALVIAWSADAPHRLGEVALFEGSRPYVLGRGDGQGELRARFFRQRPGELMPAGPLESLAISRQQLAIMRRGERLEVERVGRCQLAISGRVVDRGVVEAGDTVAVGGQLLFLCASREPVARELLHFRLQDAPVFAEPDALGMSGESPAIWELRDELAFAAGAGKHLLLQGPSGTGKELAARAVHRQSSRAPRPFVARNAATFPSALIDAELFGNARNYPNPGMADRLGLVGQAHGGMLFLDEIAELPVDLQSHLLRVLDGDGEYQRLGEATTRRSDFRLVAATNRDPSALKHDLLARLTVRISLPPLEARREDIPILVRLLLLAAAKESPQAERFVESRAGGRSEPRVEAALIDALVRRSYEGHVRELDSLLWRAMSESRDDRILLPAELRARTTSVPAAEPAEDRVRSILDREKGNVRLAARALGLSSRYALYRLMKKYGIEMQGSPEPGEE